MAHQLVRAHPLSHAFLVPVFLAPSLLSYRPSASTSRSFSTTQMRNRDTKDRNRKRGVSALRRTGPKYTLPVSKEPLPEPVLDPKKRSKPVGNKKHGLWDFFDKDQKPFGEPETVAHHGRPWAVEELRAKSFEDLHCLWWVCVKERNRIVTQQHELERAEAGYGEAEYEERDKVVRRTMQRIKHALTERWYAYEEARKLAEKSPEYKSYLEDPLESAEDEAEGAGSSLVSNNSVSSSRSPAAPAESPPS